MRGRFETELAREFIHFRIVAQRYDATQRVLSVTIRGRDMQGQRGRVTLRYDGR